MKIYEAVTLPLSIEARLLSFILDPSEVKEYDPPLLTLVKNGVDDLLNKWQINNNVTSLFNDFFDFCKEFSNYIFNNADPNPVIKETLLQYMNDWIEQINQTIKQHNILERISSTIAHLNDVQRKEIEDILATSPPIQYR